MDLFHMNAMARFALFLIGAAGLLSLLDHVEAQQSCINTCTDSANVLTQLKSCSGCGTDDWSCFCQCQQYTDALLSCAEQYCTGSDVINSIVSFCADQGVTLNYSSTSLSPSSNPTSISSIESAISSALTATSSTTSLSATDSADLSAYLAAAIPSTAQQQSSAACFVNSPYSYYSTPSWYSTLPTQAQTFYSSVNQGNTAACTLSSSQAAALANSNSGSSNNNSHRSGLSAGAIAGIVIGSILAALLLAALLWCCLRRRRRARRNAPVGSNAKYMENGSRGALNGTLGTNATYFNEKRDPVRSGAPRSGMPGSGVPVSHHAIPVVGEGGFGVSNEMTQPNGYSTTTTTRTTIRSKPRNPGYANPPNQTSRPPPQPISGQALANNNGSPPGVIQNNEGRRAF